MLARFQSLIGVFLLLLCTPIHQSTAEEPRNSAKPVQLMLRLNEHEVFPGQSVRLEESIPASVETGFRGIGHDVISIGRYDEKVASLVNLRPKEFDAVEPNDEFDGLLGGYMSSAGITFTSQNPRQKGIEFEFRPKRLGIYMITASWGIKGKDEWIASNPVILIVKPPTGSNGKPIVKPEWLKETNE